MNWCQGSVNVKMENMTKIMEKRINKVAGMTKTPEDIVFHKMTNENEMDISLTSHINPCGS